MSKVHELIAIINGDGGHSIEELGEEKAAELAICRVYELKQNLAESYSKEDIEAAICKTKEGMWEIVAHDRKSYVDFAECALDGVINELSH